MMEGPDPELRLSTLQYDTLLSESKHNADEVQRLKALLRQHNIEFDISLPVSIKYVSKNSPSEESDDGLKPRLPTEILLRILGFALISPVPIIDPFYLDNTSMFSAWVYHRCTEQRVCVSCWSRTGLSLHKPLLWRISQRYRQSFDQQSSMSHSE